MQPNTTEKAKINNAIIILMYAIKKPQPGSSSEDPWMNPVSWSGFSGQVPSLTSEAGYRP